MLHGDHKLHSSSAVSHIVLCCMSEEVRKAVSKSVLYSVLGCSLNWFCLLTLLPCYRVALSTPLFPFFPVGHS